MTWSQGPRSAASRHPFRTAPAVRDAASAAGTGTGKTRQLAAPQKATLDHVLGLAAADAPPPPFVVAPASLELLAEHAAGRPLLLAVDDAHWIDEASLDVLLFVGRRARTDRIVMVLATREPAPVDPGQIRSGTS